MIRLENEIMFVEIEKIGAQLCKVYRKDLAIDYIWHGDDKYWGRHAPILFPIVGKVANDTYYHEGVAYHLPQHGFARDTEFFVRDVSDIHVVFEICSQGQDNYPFAYVLEITYRLDQEVLFIDWTVKNLSETQMYFSIGAHPAFSTQLIAGDHFKDYYLTFQQPEDLTAMLLDPSLGLFNGEVSEVAEDTNQLALDYSLFERDALVYNNFQGGAMTLRSHNHSHGVTYQFKDFPYVALWTPPGKEAEFICIEPWYGYADTIEGPFEISKKPGIQQLAKNGCFTSQQIMCFF
ncbi:MAG: aldose 1-epimerase family protein [Culicoidibacterales bacterium]